jgi:hypothetical protein
MTDAQFGPFRLLLPRTRAGATSRAAAPAEELRRLTNPRSQAPESATFAIASATRA